MAKPTPADMGISLEDARFFYEKLDPIIRGSEQQQDLELIRRYFRAYMYCWKSVLHFVQEAKGSSWCKEWALQLDPNDYEVFECLRKTRNHDTHVGMIEVKGEIAAGLFPIVMFQPGKGSGDRRELISCCERGLCVAEHLIREYLESGP
jgi:hypothetical protein